MLPPPVSPENNRPRRVAPPGALCHTVLMSETTNTGVIHFFDMGAVLRSHAWNPKDRKSVYMAETTCEHCVSRMLDRGFLTETDVRAMGTPTHRFDNLLARREWEAHQAAEWEVIRLGEQAMAEMGLLR